MPKRKNRSTAQTSSNPKKAANDPPNASLSTAIKVLTHSDPFFTCPTTGASYFHSLTIQYKDNDDDNNNVNSNYPILQVVINSNDVVALKHEAGHPDQPFRRIKWFIGHVLAFVKDQHGKFSIIYRHLLRLKSEVKLFMSKDSIKQCCKDTRKESSLVESSFVHTISVDCLLPAQIQVRIMEASKVLMIDSICDGQASGLEFYCLHRIDPNGKHIKIQDWGIANKQLIDKNTTTATDYLQRGWDDWRQSLLKDNQDVSVVNYAVETFPTWAHGQLPISQRWKTVDLASYDILSNHDTAKEKPAINEQPIAKEGSPRYSSRKRAKKDEQVENKAINITARTTRIKNKVQKDDKLAVKSQKVAKKSIRNSTNTPKNDFIRHYDADSVASIESDNSSFSTDDDSINHLKTRKTTAKNSTRKNDRRKNQRATNIATIKTSTEFNKSNSLNANGSRAKTPTTNSIAPDKTTGHDRRQVMWPELHIKPGPTLFKLKQSNKSTEWEFVEGVDMDYDISYCHGLVEPPTNQRRWEVRVGDVVAIRSVQYVGEKPEKLMSKTQRPYIFHPFLGPWDPGQVVSVYNKGDSNKYFMQVRWMYRIDDLPEPIIDAIENIMQLNDLGSNSWDSLSRRMLVEMDEHVQELPIHTAVGRVTVTGKLSLLERRLDVYQTSTKIPQITMLCCFGLRTKDGSPTLEQVMDWANYKRNLIGPLSRGLLCPRSWSAKLKPLQKLYAMSLCERYNIPNVQELKPIHDDHSCIPVTVVGGDVPYWSKETLDRNVVKGLESIYHSLDYEYYTSAKLSISKNCYSARAIARKSIQTINWTLKVGDTVCIADTNLTYNSLLTSNVLLPVMKSVWHPISGPWKYGQVVSIYKNKGKNDRLFSEIRWFYRLSDIPPEKRRHISAGGKSKHNDDIIYESDTIDVDIPVSWILGRVVVSFNDVVKTQENNHMETTPNQVPFVKCQCSAFYLSQVQKFQPLFYSTNYQKQMLCRGIGLSKHLSKSPDLRELIEKHFDLYIDDLDNDGDSIASTQHSKCSKFIATRQILLNQTTRQFYYQVAVKPKWEAFAYPDVVCNKFDRQGKEWVLHLGDFIAVKADDNAVDINRSYPFSIPWDVFQVSAICLDKEDTKKDQQIRHFKIFGKRFILHQSVCDSKDEVPICYETNGSNMVDINPESVLGPMLLVSRSSLAYNSVYNWSQTFMPLCVCIYGGVHSDLVSTENSQPTLINVVERIISHCSEYESAEKDHIYVLMNERKLEDKFVQSLGSNVRLINIGNIKNDDVLDDADDITSVASSTDYFKNSEAEVLSTGNILLRDNNSGRTFFEDIEIGPPYSQYQKLLNLTLPSVKRRRWKVCVGDVVAVHVAHNFTSRTVYGVGIDNRAKHFPFNVPWCVAEIAAIWQDSESDWQVEIRWYYRWYELPSRLYSNVPEYNADQTEEIFESDDYAVCDVSSLLSPVILYSKPTIIKEKVEHNGMPALEMSCESLWSTRRMILVPHGGSGGRVERCLSGSSIAQMDKIQSVILAKIKANKSFDYAKTSTEEEEASTIPKFQKAFNSVIEFFSLTDAAKKAYDDSFTLIGREEERLQLYSFLTNAIQGRNENCKSSIFVAGPPGVGKTVTIQAVIRELCSKMLDGKIQPFRFVAMNGLEMRNPLEAYTKLWDMLGNKQLKPTLAAAKLEDFFTQSSNGKGETIVLLLDEIDYLVTKDQSVLYNFFDWPSRSLESQSKNRLIVLGVSNTLNLPERLHHRILSRIGKLRCFFNAYKADQITDILFAKAKLAAPDYEVFQSDALIFAAKKTAAQSGDLRKAFHFCREAAEFALQKYMNSLKEKPVNDDDNNGPVVHITDVAEISKQSFQNPRYKALSNCSSFEVLVMVALAALTKSTGREQGGFDLEELLTKMESMAKLMSDTRYLPAPNVGETLRLLTQLHEASLINLYTPCNVSITYSVSLAGSGGPWPLTTLAVDDIMVYLALKFTMHAQLAHRFLSQM